ncbi:hydrogenase expression/formation protein HupK [Rubellimicrobium arenae]|uniref:hydrogenase expression/formation protein HupK n=1 Tax=Rubellimicrobium arenae TaxID=2817372 RepID=UPI001B309281|nr:hydrogenase expression/formation protein HupK [Rubellimicrobium arenae]
MDGAVVSGRLVAVRAPGLPVEALLLGKPAEEAAALLPRLFNLCRAAQGLAGRVALGLPAPEGAAGDLRREIARDHLMKLHLAWPAYFARAAMPLPPDWVSGSRAAREALFGPPGRMPATLADLGAFLASGHGIAPTLSAISGCFRPGEAVTPALPLVEPATAHEVRAVENSVAARQAAHPLMRVVEAGWGRSPFWRALGRALDLEACLNDALPGVEAGPGRVAVPAARGLYVVTARVSQGRVAAFARVTPTDHLLAPGGVLDLALATLDPTRAALAPLVLDILDPCSPVRLREADHA